MKKLSVFSVMILMGLVGYASTGTTSIKSASGYSGVGGMTAYDIKPEVYQYHYDHGFTGVDAMGWDANLQYAWSRAGAGITCQINFDKDKVISQLINAYGEEEIIHDMNGIMFHHLQSEKITNFCTADRVQEIKTVIANIEQGKIPKPFSK